MVVQFVIAKALNFLNHGIPLGFEVFVALAGKQPPGQLSQSGIDGVAPVSAPAALISPLQSFHTFAFSLFAFSDMITLSSVRKDDNTFSG